MARTLRKVAVRLTVACVGAAALMCNGSPARAQVPAPAAAGAGLGGVTIPTRAGAVTLPLLPKGSSKDVALPFTAQHVAVHWAGAAGAQVVVAFSRDGKAFGTALDAGRDEVGEERGDGRTYGAVLPAGGARFARVSSDAALGNVSVLALADGERRPALRAAAAPGARVSVAVIPRSGWGADESLRFDAAGTEVWAPTFWPVQKLIVHHTAGTNADPDPPATIRAIYYYHAVTQGWGDIGYNFLVDEAGRVYKGRSSHAPGSAADTLTGEDGAGRGVMGAHALGFNAGTVGIALLGNFVDRDATGAAKNALQDLLAAKAGAHGIDPLGSSTYVNPQTGAPLAFPNIAGHRDVNATECPGGVFYATLPFLRLGVALQLLAGTVALPPLIGAAGG